MQFVIENGHNMFQKLPIIVLVTYTQARKYFSPEVSVKQRNLRGPRLRTRKGHDIFVFEEIPYAKPLAEDLRFRVRQKMSCR